MSCPPRMRGCRAGCLHRQMVEDYYAQRDARDAAREQGECMQMEDDDFRSYWPPTHFKEWLVGQKGRMIQDPEGLPA